MTPHGMTEREQAIMNLFEGGLPKDGICANMNVGRGYVDAVVGRYHFPNLDREMSRSEAKVRIADLAYQRALAASGGRFA